MAVRERRNIRVEELATALEIMEVSRRSYDEGGRFDDVRLSEMLLEDIQLSVLQLRSRLREDRTLREAGK